MNVHTYLDEGWLVMELEGDVADETRETWRALRSDIPWEQSRWVVLDVTAVAGASDRFVETIVGIAADAHNRGGCAALVGENEETRQRFGALQAVDYVFTAESIQQVKDGLPGPEASD